MPVKLFVTILLFLSTTIQIKAQQQTADFGLFAGGATPFSDYSRIQPLQSVNFNMGLFYRYNFNSRISFRVMGIYGRVGATGYLDDNTSERSFNKPVFDLGAAVEVNFLDFLLGVEKMNFSPYLLYGAGVSFYSSDAFNTVISPNISLGGGIKYAIAKRWGIGAEISTRKLFNDDLDNLNNPYSTIFLEDVNDNWHNNDWINYFGLTLTYKFYWGKKPCPAYNSIN